MRTSRYSTEVGILDFITPTTHQAYVVETGDLGLENQFVTFREVLASWGYATALFGKWHVGDWRSPDGGKYHPTRHGFSPFFGFIGGSAGPMDPEIEIDGKPRNLEGYTDDILTAAAIAYLRETHERPFFLQLALRSPHSPWLPAPAEDTAPFSALEAALPESNYPELDVDRAKKMMREYLICISGVDRQVGRVVAAARRIRTSHTGRSATPVLRLRLRCITTGGQQAQRSSRKILPSLSTRLPDGVIVTHSPAP